MSHVTIFKNLLWHVTKPEKDPCCHVDFRGREPFHWCVRGLSKNPYFCRFGSLVYLPPGDQNNLIYHQTHEIRAAPYRNTICFDISEGYLRSPEFHYEIIGPWHKECIVMTVFRSLGEMPKFPTVGWQKTCWETLVTCLWNVCDKSQKAICTTCWGYRITM